MEHLTKTVVYALSSLCTPGEVIGKRRGARIWKTGLDYSISPSELATKLQDITRLLTMKRKAKFFSPLWDTTDIVTRAVARTIFVTLSLFAAGPGSTAEFHVSDDLEYGCLIKMSGPIENGDKTRLIAAMKYASSQPQFANLMKYTKDASGETAYTTSRPLNLCLDSPGGSYVEASKLADFVNRRLGTVVGAGAHCESACALVFMAGATQHTEVDIGLNVNRFLHVDGKLGFHAPKLVVPEGSYDAESVRRAYEVSVEATFEILRNQTKFKFPASLAARMHATPPSGMFYVTRVEEAARWGISVIGVDRPTALSEDVQRTACANLFASTTDRISSDPDIWWDHSPEYWPVERNEKRGFTFHEIGPALSGSCKVEVGEKVLSRDLSLISFVWGDAPAIRQSVWGNASIINGAPSVDFGFLQNYMSWPGDTPLSALPRNGRIAPVIEAGTCHIFDEESKRELLRQDCALIREVQLDGSVVRVFEGERVALPSWVNRDDLWSGYWASSTPEPVPAPQCLSHPDTGQNFCFVASLN